MKRMFLCVMATLAIGQSWSRTDDAIVWRDEIVTALQFRDQCFREQGVAIVGTDYRRSFDAVRAAVEATGVTAVGTASEKNREIWRLFCFGMATRSSAPDESIRLITQAIEQARDKPGVLWTLCGEFHYANEPRWETMGIDELERAFLTRGMRSAPVIAQSLLGFAREEERKRNGDDAARYYRWAARFDHHLTWAPIRQGWAAFMRTPGDAVGEFQNAVRMGMHSWRIQAAAAYYLYRWLLLMGVFFTVGIIAVLSIKHLPAGVHPLCERLPRDIHPTLKQIYCIALILSTGFLSVILLLWILLLMIWRQAGKQEKAALACAAILLACAPGAVHVENMLRAPLLPDNAATLYQKALDETPYPALREKMENALALHRDDYLTHLAGGIYALKEGDTRTALARIQKARILNPADPVAPSMLGNIHYFNGEIDKAIKSYTESVTNNPDDAAAYFCLGQCYTRTFEADKGIGYMTKASRINPEMIRTFIERNDYLFSRHWPPLRQCIFPDYTPAYYWKSVFPRYSDCWVTTRRQWQALFLGIPPTASMCVAGILLVLLIPLGMTHHPRKRIKIACICPLCGRRICRACKRGIFCRTCYEIVSQMADEKTRKQVRARIVQKKRTVQRLIRGAMDIVFPGGGALYERETGIIIPELIALIGASCAYASYWMWYVTVPAYPRESGAGVLGVLLVVPALFHISCIVYAVKRMIRYGRA